MTNADLRSLLAAATPGPWIASKANIHWRIRAENGHYIGDPAVRMNWRNEKDVTLIAAMRNELPALLDRLESAEARVQKLEAALRSLTTAVVCIEDMDKFEHADHELHAALTAARNALEKP